ncbi:MAG: PTS ascorbate transporter subunit IIC [Cardiobacteriaceae bacterium]|nr:PTS ascorbate transporter subunit IIC [Cardiobacteriaceae bacterium]
MSTFLNDVARFVLDNILNNAPVLMGLIAMLGLLLQRKPLPDVVKGALMTAFGMVILQAGVGILVGIIAPINQAVQAQMGVSTGEGLSDVAFTAEYGGIVGMSMFIGLILHVLIARFTPIKTIFLTGHMLWWFPFVIVAGGVEAKLDGAMLIAVSAVLSALYWSLMPWIMRRFVWDATGDESFLIGHPTGILALLSGYVAKAAGNKARSTEDLQIPQSLSFFKEISVAGAMVMFLIYLVAGVFLPTLAPEGKSLFFVAIDAGLKFAAGLLVMLYGVRMLISQIIPAFKGIAEKIVPGAKPAFDVPILFGYRPNAVIIGFVVAMVASTVMILITNYFNVFGVLLLPLVVTSFFECGGAAVIGEGQGGLRGAIVGSISAAILMVVLVGLSAAIYSHTIQNWILIFGGNDLSLSGLVSYYISLIFGG